MSIKIAHLSDLHIGYKATRIETPMGLNVREEDGYRLFSALINSIIKHEVDVVIISGDVFHSPTPEVRPIIAVQNGLRKLASTGISVYILAGNHDQNDVKADIASSKIMHDELRKIYSHVEPYVKHEVLPGVHFHMVSHHMYSEQETTMANIKPIEGEVNIFATHGSVIDPLLKEKLHTEQSPREIVIPDFLLDDYHWDFSFLGHIHERGFVGSKDGKTDNLNKRVYYNGSLLRRGFADKECELGRGWTLWTLSSDGKLTPKPIQLPQRPQVDFDIIDATGKTATQISDEIIINLKNTQVNNVSEFDIKIAPMLRQRIKNLDPSKHAALDWSSINNNSKHAIMWGIRQISETAQKKEEKEKPQLVDLSLPESTDVVHIFDEWIGKSASLAKTDKSMKEKITDQTRKFVEFGQEEILNE